MKPKKLNKYSKTTEEYLWTKEVAEWHFISGIPQVFFNQQNFCKVLSLWTQTGRLAKRSWEKMEHNVENSKTNYETNCRREG